MRWGNRGKRRGEEDALQPGAGDSRLQPGASRTLLLTVTVLTAIIWPRGALADVLAVASIEPAALPQVLSTAPSTAAPPPQPQSSLLFSSSVPPSLSTDPTPSTGRPRSPAGPAPPPPVDSQREPKDTPLTAVAAGSGSLPPGGEPGYSGGSAPLPWLPQLVLGSGPIGTALAGALAVLPLLLCLWLLLLGRAWGETRKLRSSRIRLAMASELGLSPRELAGLDTDGLMKLREQIAFDELTGVLRRAAGIEAVEREMARVERMKTPLSAAFIDVDGLKRVNDSRGHAAGDALLRGVAGLLREGLRGQDLIFRYGGDEFVCVLPDCDLSSSERKLEGLREEGGRRGCRFSFGVAEVHENDDLVSFLGRADSRLYQGRAEGRIDGEGATVIWLPNGEPGFTPGRASRPARGRL
jgi:diguanylate cyclase (GGDEF)-like protein